MVARYGGEELAVILPDTPSEDAADLAEKLRAAVEGLHLTHSANPEGAGFVTVSIGVATALSRDGGTIDMPQGLLISADMALYKAKHDHTVPTARGMSVLYLAISSSRPVIKYVPSSIVPRGGLRRRHAPARQTEPRLCVATVELG